MLLALANALEGGKYSSWVQPMLLCPLHVLNLLAAEWAGARLLYPRPLLTTSDWFGVAEQPPDCTA